MARCVLVRAACDNAWQLLTIILDKSRLWRERLRARRCSPRAAPRDVCRGPSWHGVCTPYDSRSAAGCLCERELGSGRTMTHQKCTRAYSQSVVGSRCRRRSRGEWRECARAGALRAQARHHRAAGRQALCALILSVCGKPGMCEHIQSKHYAPRGAAGASEGSGGAIPISHDLDPYRQSARLSEITGDTWSYNDARRAYQRSV